MQPPELKNFRNSRWRYSQFVILALIVAGAVYGLSALSALISLAIGAAVGIAYWLFERSRGVI